MRILLVDLEAERGVKGFQPEPLKIVAELLDAWLVTDGWMWIRAAGLRIGRIFAASSVDVIEPLRLQVIRLKILIGDRPGRRDSVNVANLAEVFLAQTEEGGAVKFGVASHVVVRVWVKRLSVLVAPFLLGLVLIPFAPDEVISMSVNHKHWNFRDGSDARCKSRAATA